MAAARVRSPWVMVVFPWRRCAEVPRDRDIATATYHSEPEGIPQGPARANTRRGGGLSEGVTGIRDSNVVSYIDSGPLGDAGRGLLTDGSQAPRPPRRAETTMRQSGLRM